jgi:LysR family hydrogen peroxide-inducible transcriptional activator
VSTSDSASDLIKVRPFARPVPDRRVVLAWRKSFPRPEAIETLRQAILACDLPQVTKIQ